MADEKWSEHLHPLRNNPASRPLSLNAPKPQMSRRMKEKQLYIKK